MRRNKKWISKKAMDKAIKTCDKVDSSDMRNIRNAIGNLKNANSRLGMIDDLEVNKVKNTISQLISKLESM